MNWEFILIAYSGLFAGYLQCLISPEELKDGYKYFFQIQNTTISAGIYIAVRGIVGQGIYGIPVALAIAAIAFILVYKRDYYGKLFVLTPFLLYLESSVPMIMLLFLAGMARGSMDGIGHVHGRKLRDKTKLLKSIFLKYILYFPLGMLPFVIQAIL